MKKWIKRVGIVIAILLFIALSVLSSWSPQKTELIRDQNGEVLPNSIASIENIDFNGVSQRLLIRGWDKTNPVLLHIHGGPGAPDRAIIRLLNAHIEDIFTVVYWDQRGTGGSYQNNIDTASMSLDQIAMDGISISEYLRDRFSKDKIYIQGHSWGTSVGITMAQKSPELFHAYLGIGQMAHSIQSEKTSYQYALNEAVKAQNEEDISILKEIGPPPYSSDEWTENSLKQRQVLWKYENPSRPLNQSMFQIYMLYIRHPEYSISDKIGLIKGMDLTANYLWDDAMNVNFFETIPDLETSVFIFQGKYDKHTATSVAKAYFDSLNALEKYYYEFENSAHAPQYEEYQKYKKIIVEEVLN